MTTPRKKKPRPRLSSHWEGYCVVRGPPAELRLKWYQMVYYAMCAGQTECCLMKVSLGGTKADARVVSVNNSTHREIVELNARLREPVEEWCELHEISYYVKRPTDNSKGRPKIMGDQCIDSDFAYLMACWSTPRDYIYDPPNPFESSSE